MERDRVFSKIRVGPLEDVEGQLEKHLIIGNFLALGGHVVVDVLGY
jgi:hypothetical protein